MAGKPNADTTHMGNEEIGKSNLHHAKRPPGQKPGGFLHQRGGMSLRDSGKWPGALAAVLVVAGVGSYIYHRSIHPDPDGQAHGHSPAVKKAEDAKYAAQS